ncbi:damage-inducible mutagenesis protein, partial [Rhizobium leguminosarum]|nr:damage-inducible mutagenesis protein [Rhizobium ruizarguesonis]
MSAPDAVLRDLRSSLARIERGTAGDAAPPPISLSAQIDDHLPGGGLARGALHEVQASDLGAGLALCALILSRTDGPVLWISAGAEG